MRIRPMSQEERKGEYEAFLSANPSNPDVLRECVDEAYWASGFGGHAPVSTYGTGDGITVVVDRTRTGGTTPVRALLGVTTKDVVSVSLAAESVPFVQDGRWVLMQPSDTSTGSTADLQVKTADALLPVSTRSYC